MLIESLTQAALLPLATQRNNNAPVSLFYYLENFNTVLAWVRERYRDLLEQDEADFIERFAALPVESKALLVRMTMRKGNLFRASKLLYEEIGDTHRAAQCLIDLGWVESDPQITVEQLFALLTKKELAQALGLRGEQAAKKSEMLAHAQASYEQARQFSVWYPASNDTIFEVCVADICDRIRLMFFGNLHQDWSEFVLADLGVWKYEKVVFLPRSRAFQSRQDVDAYLHLEACRQQLHADEPLENLEQDLAAIICESSWLESRRAKILFRIAQRHEQLGDWSNALRLYTLCTYPGARLRRIRVLEKNAQYHAAMQLARTAETEPESEAEAQQLQRIRPRLSRKLGQVRPAAAPRLQVPRIELQLARPTDWCSVEQVAADYFERTNETSHVYYVENALINSLFGLLCWDAIFSAIPGAFFHPFQIGPADLQTPDFFQRRRQQFDACLSQLASSRYKQTIRETFLRKAGIQSPFVAWEVLSDILLEHALSCLPAEHLAKWFERMLRDLASNCAGFPDLIQFWPQQARYRMIEVKGPGDRLQDNQTRLLDFCLAHDMPVAVCQVRWKSDHE